MKDYYDPIFVEKLFDSMSSSYATMNYLTSFGFSERWRKQCVSKLNIEQDKVIVDLMTGMGESWPYIIKKMTGDARLIGLDFSANMLKRAYLKKEKYKDKQIDILQENVFENSIESQSVDYVFSGFGLKTFNETQLKLLAQEIKRILKVNGKFSLIDVSVPPNKFLRLLYMFYLKQVIPFLGAIFLGNPKDYQMLGIYTEAFGNSREVEKIFKAQGLEINYVNYFFGCATGITGRKIT